MARKTVDKATVEQARTAIHRLQREADRISTRDKAAGDLMTAEYFSGRWEGLEMADNILRAMLDGRDVDAVYG